MKGLFLKTFVWFWLTTIITISATYFISSRLTDSNWDHHDVNEIINHYFEELEEELNEHGIKEFSKQLKHQRLPRGIGILLIDNHHNIVAVKRIPEPVLQYYLDKGQWPKPRGRQLSIKQKTFAMDDKKLTLFILWLPKKLHAKYRDHKPWFQPFERTPIWAGFRLLVALLVSGLICYLLARYISKPILKLRSAVNQVEQGNYDIEVASEFKNRNDEIAGLASDFDQMSAEIKSQFQQREDLLRDISHELRSPLARMRIASELIKSKSLTPNLSEVERIETEIHRLDELIGEIIDFSRLENQSAEISQQQFDLLELVNSIIDDVNFEGKAESKQVLLDTNSQQIPLNANKILIARAMENILRNAMKYTAANTNVRCSVDILRNTVSIRVKDQGPGVPEQQLEKIFEPFYRLSKSRDRDSGGTGLGLAISRRAIELHGGEIKAINASDDGLVITIRLPLEV